MKSVREIESTRSVLVQRFLREQIAIVAVLKGVSRTEDIDKRRVSLYVRRAEAVRSSQRRPTLRVVSKNSIELQTERLRCYGCHAYRFSVKARHTMPVSASSFASVTVDDVGYAACRW